MKCARTIHTHNMYRTSVYTPRELHVGWNGREGGGGVKSNFGDCTVCHYVFVCSTAPSTAIYANRARACDGHKRIEHVAEAAAVQFLS